MRSTQQGKMKDIVELKDKGCIESVTSTGLKVNSSMNCNKMCERVHALHACACQTKSHIHENLSENVPIWL